MYDSIAQNKRATHLASALVPARAPAITLAILAALFVFVLFSTPALAAAKLTASKDDSTDPVAEGESFTYTIVVENTGTDDVTNVTVDDTAPIGITFTSATTDKGTCSTFSPAHCTIGTLTPGETATVTIKATPNGTVFGTVTNTAKITSSNAPDVTATEDTDIVPDLDITKEGFPTTVQEGDFILYTLTVDNQGTHPAQNVRIIDTLPDEVEFVPPPSGSAGDCKEKSSGEIECKLGTVNGGISEEIEILVEATATGDVTNLAEVFATGSDEAIDSDTADTTIDNDGGEDGDGGGGGGGSGTHHRDRVRDLQRAIDDLNNLDGELSTLESDQYNGEDTLGSNGNSDVSAVDDSTPGASASANGDEDTLGPVSGPQGDVVDEVPTSGPLPNTGGVPVATGTVLALVLFGAGLLAVRLVMVWRGRRT